MRKYLMRYYYYNSKNPDKVNVIKKEVKSNSVGNALSMYDPYNMDLPVKNLLNWTAKRV